MPDKPTRLETGNPGVFTDLGAIARDVAIQALGSTDAPIGQADDLVAIVSGQALALTVQMRVEQVVKHGHTPDSDLMLPIGLLPTEVQNMAGLARAAIGITGSDRNLDAGVKRLARTAALCWAAIDRILAAQAGGQTDC
jgi:hypothetical protein